MIHIMLLLYIVYVNVLYTNTHFLNVANIHCTIIVVITVEANDGKNNEY